MEKIIQITGESTNLYGLGEEGGLYRVSYPYDEDEKIEWRLMIPPPSN